MPGMADERHLMDRLWERVRRLLPPSPRGRPGAAPGPVTGRASRRHEAWTEAGMWRRVRAAVLRELDAADRLNTSARAVGGTLVEAKTGGRRSARAATGTG